MLKMSQVYLVMKMIMFHPVKVKEYFPEALITGKDK